MKLGTLCPGEIIHPYCGWLVSYTGPRKVSSFVYHGLLVSVVNDDRHNLVGATKLVNIVSGEYTGMGVAIRHG